MCIESFKQALRFFPSIFTNDKFAAFTCHSWLLTPAFLEILPPSNIRWFCSQFVQLPDCTNEHQLFSRVFDSVPLEKTEQAFAALPQDTQLQRIVRDVLLKQEMRRGYGFIPVDRVAQMKVDQ